MHKHIEVPEGPKASLTACFLFMATIALWGHAAVSGKLLDARNLTMVVGILCYSPTGAAESQPVSQAESGRDQKESKMDNRAMVEEGWLRIHTGEYEVGFRRSTAWTLGYANFQGKKLLVPRGGMQTVIVLEGRGFTGTNHGGEQVEGLSLVVDGEEHAFHEGLEVAGDEFTFVKDSRLGPYGHTARVTVSPGGIKEDLRFEVVGDDSMVPWMYVFMHCFTNETEDWLVGLADGGEQRGRFRDDGTFSLKKDIHWAALYAPAEELGCVYVYPEPYEGLAEGGNKAYRNAFWNRDYDNKLYFRPKLPRGKGRKFGYSVRLQAFTAKPEEWETRARDLMRDLGVPVEEDDG
jgi:hypothetical protein